MIVLVDMDQVLADFDGAWDDLWRTEHPDLPYAPSCSRSTFYIADGYPPGLREEVAQIYKRPGFFRSLSPLAGALEGMSALRAAGHDVFICTAPLSEYTHCVLEKYQWVEDHFGSDWVRRIVMTKDKTLVQGDLLIDDKPHVTGAARPAWTHVRFTQSYNAHLPGPRLTWATALEVVAALGLTSTARRPVEGP